MKEKSEVGTLVKSFLSKIKIEFGKEDKVVRMDNGSEFKFGPMKNFYCEKGII